MIIKFPGESNIFNKEEAEAIVESEEAEKGISIYECPCGCGTVNFVLIGTPDKKDVLFMLETIKHGIMEPDHGEDI